MLTRSASTLAFMTPLGWSNAALRFVREYLESKNWSLLRGMLIRSHQVTIAVSLVVGLLLVALSYLPVSENLAVGFRYAALILPFQSLVYLRRKIFLALDHLKASMLVQDVLPPLLVVVALLFVDVSKASEAILIYVFASLLTFFLASIWLRHAFPLEGRHARPTWRTRFWFSVAWPMLLGSVSQVLMQRTDIIMLGALANMEAVGQYAAASQLSVLNVFIISAINAITAPQLASAYQQRDAQRFKTILRKSQIWAVVGALPPFIIIIMIPAYLLQLFGNGFTGRGLVAHHLELWAIPEGYDRFY
ncbi:MAG: oligosaccharide flippase family protein [Trueperaceae bacterium]|nr:oligosaccharide flippase family protein [Trueperaceae bacterium]